MYEKFDSQTVGDPIGCMCGGGSGLWGNHMGRWYRLNVNIQPVTHRFPVKPYQIQSGPNVYGRFGRMEIENMASRIIRHAQEVGEWRDFHPNEVKIWSDDLDWFADMGFIIKKPENMYGFTAGLVMEFFEQYPAPAEALVTS